MFYFHKVAYVHYLGEVDIFSYMSKKEISSSLQQCKNYKNQSRFPKVMITSVLPPFLCSQCIFCGNWTGSETYHSWERDRKSIPV